jgi:hypothetical protein
MTKIKSYITDTNVTGSDKWIGTDANANSRTKNFTPTGLADYFNKNQVIQSENSLRFVYDTIETGDSRIDGSFSFDTEVGATVAFSSISSLVFNKKAKSGKVVKDFMISMVNRKILIQKSDDLNIFGYYTLTDFQQRLSEPDFYDASLTYISGNGSIEEDEDYFVSLLQFDTVEAADKHYAFEVEVASARTTWNIQHNLAKFPSVTVVLSTGQKGYGDVTYVDSNNLTITFAGDESGKAYMN